MERGRPVRTTQDKLRLMLQRLLADRFKLAARRKTQVAAAYVLTRGKGPSWW
jgi:uncharacterized protein (TIGR03435 family)